MGSYLSCTIPTSFAGGGGPAKVIFPAGVTRKFESTVNAAELMLDAPNHFVVNAAGMDIGHKFSPLAADEELEMGGLYVLLPMRRLNSTVTAGDMGLLLMAANNRKAVILPEEEEKAAVGSVTFRFRLEDLEEMKEVELRYRMNRCRSRKPMLETIVEENSIISSR